MYRYEPAVLVTAEDRTEKLRVLLKKQFKNIDNYLEIALGEAVTLVSANSTIESVEASGLIYTIAKNKILNELKRQRRFQTLENGTNFQTEKGLIVDSPEVLILSGMTIDEWMSHLTPKQLRVVELKEQGLSIGEIAKIEQISYHAVNERLKEIRKKFKKYLLTTY